jgi:hypothetical protein
LELTIIFVLVVVLLWKKGISDKNQSRSASYWVSDSCTYRYPRFFIIVVVPFPVIILVPLLIIVFILVVFIIIPCWYEVCNSI